MLHYKISDQNLRKLQQLLVAFQEASKTISEYSEEKRLFIKKQSLISNIGASTRIENAVLTDVEIEWIDTEISTEPHNEYRNKERFIKDKLSKDKERSIEEVAGYRKSLQLIFAIYNDLHPLKISDIKGLHREMLQYYSHADYHLGEFKKQPNSVLETDMNSGEKRVVLKTADPGIVTETSMNDLIAWYNNEIMTDPWPLSVAVEFVFRFLAIHPFQDGNGRLSRLLFHLVLMTGVGSFFPEVIPYIAVDRSIEQTRSHYYYVLRRCSAGLFQVDPGKYNYNYLLEYMSDVLINSLNNLLYYDQKYSRLQSLSEKALTVLNCFKDKPEHSLKTNEIIDKTGFPRRTVIYSLNSLIQGLFIQKFGKGAGTRYKLVF